MATIKISTELRDGLATVDRFGLVETAGRDLNECVASKS
jgi:hypothetical protein